MKPHLAVCLLALLLGACASVPVPTDTLAAAELAVQRADSSRGNDPSPPELRNARGELDAARDAVQQRNNLQAARLADMARLDADTATARMEAVKAQFNVDAMKKTNEALRQQALRNAVNVAPIAIPAPIEPAPETPTGNY